MTNQQIKSLNLFIVTVFFLSAAWTEETVVQSEQTEPGLPVWENLFPLSPFVIMIQNRQKNTKHPFSLELSLEEPFFCMEEEAFSNISESELPVVNLFNKEKGRFRSFSIMGLLGECVLDEAEQSLSEFIGKDINGFNVPYYD